VGFETSQAQGVNVGRERKCQVWYDPFQALPRTPKGRVKETRVVREKKEKLSITEYSGKSRRENRTGGRLNQQRQGEQSARPIGRLDKGWYLIKVSERRKTKGETMKRYGFSALAKVKEKSPKARVGA